MKRPASLASKREFERVLRSGTRTRARCGTLFIAPQPDPAAPARLGLAVPVRVGGAVARNRIKRRLRASFAAASIPAGLDVVIRAHPAARSLDFQELTKELSTLGVSA